MRITEFHNEGFYHIYNRGVDKQDIFLDIYDYQRMMDTLLIKNDSTTTIKHGFRKSEIKKIILQEPYVKIHAFCLMTNHFHLLVEQKKQGGVSDYLQRVGNSYTKYFNAKYKRTGHIFESTFKDRIIESEKYLCHLSRYIHSNPHKYCKLKNKFDYIKHYKWSSLRHYLGLEKIKIVDDSIIRKYFQNIDEYEQYIFDYLFGQH
jgi:putative transposase